MVTQRLLAAKSIGACLPQLLGSGTNGYCRRSAPVLGRSKSAGAVRDSILGRLRPRTGAPRSPLPCTNLSTKPLALGGLSAHCHCEMALPSEPVTLTVTQLDELNRKLSTMRHDINNHLSLIVAAVELMRHKPQMAERMVATVAEQPARITESVRRFSTEFEQIMGITRQ